MKEEKTTEPTTGQAKSLSGRERFLRACRLEPVDRPPVWLMRQAGRYLPEYQALRNRYDFLELVRKPELATEVTLQPIRRFGLDAAILFSDILEVIAALGVSYRFEEGRGIVLDQSVQDVESIRRLSPQQVPQKLQHIPESIHRIREALRGQTALIGFAGGPWTLACFLVQGGSGMEKTTVVQWAQTHSQLFTELAERLTEGVIQSLKLQIEAGVDAVQLFDSLAGIVPEEVLDELVFKWERRVIQAIGRSAPVILFCKGVYKWDRLEATGADVLSVDAGIDLPAVASEVSPQIGLQGNLDPALLLQDPSVVGRITRRLLECMRDRRGYICNLGHGVPPKARLESVAALVDTVKGFV